jgi:hypothetical protein
VRYVIYIYIYIYNVSRLRVKLNGGAFYGLNYVIVSKFTAKINIKRSDKFIKCNVRWYELQTYEHLFVYSLYVCVTTC